MPASRRARRVGVVLVVGAVFVLVVGTVWALEAPGMSYAWQGSMISDLGALTCADAGVRWICSPRHTVFNAAQIMAGVLLLVAAVVLRGAWDRALRAAAVAVGLGLVVLGVFPADVAHAPHMVGAVLGLPISAAFLLISGARERVAPRARRLVRIVLATVVLVLSALHLVPGDTLRGIAELVSLFAMCAVFLAEAAWTALPHDAATSPPRRRSTREAGAERGRS
ncbi:DUF998 domain-containing protein [Mobilicoccus massiliensis]|uniref:DUF998 domain-containing protein n=1 Tax=Mobilicoccus massiliensis TaxID=1522310 RepID=UPI0015970F28|nr:DUF998 domain-containing protein [Mobilicoccus massiliensis]